MNIGQKLLSLTDRDIFGLRRRTSVKRPFLDSVCIRWRISKKKKKNRSRSSAFWPVNNVRSVWSTIVRDRKSENVGAVARRPDRCARFVSVERHEKLKNQHDIRVHRSRFKSGYGRFKLKSSFSRQLPQYFNRFGNASVTIKTNLNTTETKKRFSRNIAIC